MTNERLERFSNFFSDLSYENIQSIKEELEAHGINTFQCRDAIMQQIAKAKADLRIEEGKQFFDKFRKLISGLKQVNKNINATDIQIQAAFRKLEKEMTPDELQELINDSTKLDILEKLIKEQQ